MKKTVLTGFEWFVIAGTIITTLLFAAIFIGMKDALGDFNWVFTSIASVFNIFCVTLSAKGSRWNFIFGLTYNIMYAWYCVHTLHFGNAAVYGIFFVPMQIAGWFQWRKIGTNDRGQVAAKRLSKKMRIIISAVSAVAVLGIWLTLRSVGGQESEIDAIVTVICIIAQLLLTFAYMEQWYIWIAVNALTIVMWTASALSENGRMADMNIVICYAFLLLNSCNGLREWKKLSA